MEKYIPINPEKWGNEYFDNRFSNDPKRQAQFKIDQKFIHNFLKKGIVCDVGCSTGEFLKSINWDGPKYGMEISDYAKNIAADYIDFSKDIFSETNFFDCIIFRGTIQHVDIPFKMLQASYSALKPNGYLFLLSTPNTDSILYRVKKNLPFLDWERNYFIPGAKDLENALVNFGYQISAVDFPYWKTPYCRPVSDHLNFIRNIASRKFYPHAFWGSSLNLCAQKIV